MRIKNKFTLDDKVEIVVDNIYKFQEIACLVDSPRFISEAKLIKEEIGLDDPIINLETGFVDLFSSWEKIYDNWSFRNEAKSIRLEAWTKGILRKFNCSSYLRDAVVQAILFNMVVSYSGIIKVLDENSKFTGSTIAIMPTSHTTYEEIKGALREAKKLMKSNSGTYKSEDTKDTVSTIKKYREWYWKHVLGMTFQEIADEWNDKTGSDISYTVVAKDINTYQNMLL